MTHCRREVIQAQWTIILDDEFIEAWEHGIVHHCCDGIDRRFYPRIFIYAADYKEKYVFLSNVIFVNDILIKCRALIASIRDMGNFPCPRCLIPLSRVQNMGTALDRKQRKTLPRVDDETRRSNIRNAREIIYQNNYAVDSTYVEDILKNQSLVPTVVSIMTDMISADDTDVALQNAFSQRLAALGFCFFKMLVVDLMHEFELGVWKALFIHLIRILTAVDKKLVDELDRRYIFHSSQWDH
jgi:hypothetical protein